MLKRSVLIAECIDLAKEKEPTNSLEVLYIINNNNNNTTKPNHMPRIAYFYLFNYNKYPHVHDFLSFHLNTIVTLKLDFSMKYLAEGEDCINWFCNPSWSSTRYCKRSLEVQNLNQ